MSRVQTYPLGSFCWADLMTSNVQAAKAFYGELFAWRWKDIETGPNMTYSMAHLGDDEVAALMPMGDDERRAGVPPHWNAYVAVANVDEAVKKAKSLGATVLFEPSEAMEAGRMAVVQDPTQAVFSLWQAKQHPGAARFNEPQALSWFELLTTDVPRAREFYGKLFGWRLADSKAGGGYVEAWVGEKSIAGMMAIDPAWGPMPSHWGVYFRVTDCDEAAARLQRLGGRLLKEPTDIPRVGRFATFADPQGAHSSIIQLRM